MLPPSQPWTFLMNDDGEGDVVWYSLLPKLKEKNILNSDFSFTRQKIKEKSNQITPSIIEPSFNLTSI